MLQPIELSERIKSNYSHPRQARYLQLLMVLRQEVESSLEILIRYPFTTGEHTQHKVRFLCNPSITVNELSPHKQRAVYTNILRSHHLAILLRWLCVFDAFSYFLCIKLLHWLLTSRDVYTKLNLRLTLLVNEIANRCLTLASNKHFLHFIHPFSFKQNILLPCFLSYHCFIVCQVPVFYEFLLLEVLVFLNSNPLRTLMPSACQKSICGKLKSSGINQFHKNIIGTAVKMAMRTITPVKIRIAVITLSIFFVSLSVQ